MALECDAKLERKPTCGLDIDKRTQANFHQCTPKS